MRLWFRALVWKLQELSNEFYEGQLALYSSPTAARWLAQFRGREQGWRTAFRSGGCE